MRYLALKTHLKESRGKGQECIFFGENLEVLIPFFVQGKLNAVSNHPMSTIHEALSTLYIQASESDGRNRISEKLCESLWNNCSPECRLLLGEDFPQIIL
jgi:hypothetical protein